MGNYNNLKNACQQVVWISINKKTNIDFETMKFKNEYAEIFSFILRLSFKTLCKTAWVEFCCLVSDESPLGERRRFSLFFETVGKLCGHAQTPKEDQKCAHPNNRNTQVTREKKYTKNFNSETLASVRQFLIPSSTPEKYFITPI